MMPDGQADSWDTGIAPHVRRLRQRAITDRARESLLFLPMVLLAAAIGGEFTLAWIDRRWPLPEPSVVDLSPDVAASLLTTVAGATITTAGVVFSLLVVSLQLASGQFSPRVLRTFWRDRFGQVLIGLLLATFAFCVLALAQIDPDASRAPASTLVGALTLTLASIVAIVAYLNRISRQQYVGRIMERIGREGASLISELPYGSRVGRRVGEPLSQYDQVDVAGLGEPLVVQVPTDGWVQQISRRAVVAAVPAGSVVRLETRVGGYVIAGTPLATVWPAPTSPAVAKRVARGVGEATIIGATRTMQQDIDFALRQLNDIGLRALSPAVNDPTTAIETILRVASLMRPLLLSDLPAQAVRDAAGRVLLTPYDLDHAEYVGHAFDQMRRYAAPHPQVMLALVRSVRMLRSGYATAGGCIDGNGGSHRDEGRTAVLDALDAQLAAAVEAAETSGLTAAELAPIRAAASVAGSATTPAASPAAASASPAGPA